MDSIYKIKRTCYKPSSLTRGCLYALTPNSPFIRLYLGVDSSGRHLSRVIRSHNCDVCSPVDSCLFSPYRAYIVVYRGE